MKATKMPMLKVGDKLTQADIDALNDIRRERDAMEKEVTDMSRMVASSRKHNGELQEELAIAAVAAEVWDAENKALHASARVERFHDLAEAVRKQYLREWQQGAHNNLGCTACGFQWDEPRDERHSESCIVGMAKAALDDASNVARRGGGVDDDRCTCKCEPWQAHASNCPALDVPPVVQEQGGIGPWSRDDLEELRKALTTCHISALLAGEPVKDREARDARQFIYKTCIEAHQLLNEILDEQPKMEIPEDRDAILEEAVYAIGELDGGDPERDKALEDAMRTVSALKAGVVSEERQHG